MLIKFGSIVVGGRGKLGGQVYSHNRGGDYVRNNAVPTNPQTAYQQASRAILTGLSQGWSALTEAQINGWNAAVQKFKRTNVFGDAKSLSGKNLYTSLNKNLIQLGLASMDEAPSPGDAVAPISVTPSIAVTGTELDIGAEYEGALTPDNVVIRVTPPVSLGTSFVKNDLRVLFAGTAGDQPSETELYDLYEARFGTIAENQKIYVEVYTVNDVGQRTPCVSDYAIVSP